MGAPRSDARVRVAIVGGGIGRAYADAVVRRDDTSLVAVCTRHAPTSDDFAAQYGLESGYVDAREMIDAVRPDLLVLASPNDSHVEIGTFAADRGVNLVCEKPVGSGLRDAEALLRSARNAGIVHFVPFTWRFLPAMRRLREMLDAGDLGETLAVTLRYHVCTGGRPATSMGDAGSRTESAGVIAHLGSHAIDLVHWLFGPVGLFSVSSTSLSVVGGHIAPTTGGVEQMAEIHLRSASGIPIALSLNAVAPGPRVDFELRVLGAERVARVVVDWSRARDRHGRLGLARPDGAFEDVELDPSTPALEHPNPFFANFVHMTDTVVGAVRENRPATPDLESAVIAWRLISAAQNAGRPTPNAR